MAGGNIGHHMATETAPALRRALTLPLLTLYGLGVTVGAGVYVLIGVTVERAGPHAWLAFVLAGIVAGFTAFSYAELATRFPVSAGEAAYVQAGIGSRALATLTGLLVVASGLISSAAITVGAAGYIHDLTAQSVPLLSFIIVVLMGIVAWWGIMQSVAIAAAITVVEILGLVVVIVWGFGFSSMDGATMVEMTDFSTGLGVGGLAAASLLAFFAFVGFEDMVNVAEEVAEPRRTIPMAIVITLSVAMLLYVLACMATLFAVPQEVLAGSDKPLLLVFANAPSALQTSFGVVAAVATVNGVLIQLIMASRVMFGMARRRQLPRLLGQVSPMTQTPTVATACAVLIVLGLSLLLPIAQLAEWTSVIVLTVFIIVNVALLALKWKPPPTQPYFAVPAIVPVLGTATSLILLGTALL